MRSAGLFSTDQDLYAFFGHSIRRWDLMVSITGESAVTLKKLNSIRWARRLSWLMGIKHRYCDVMKALAHIALENRRCPVWWCTEVPEAVADVSVCVDSCFADKSTINATSVHLQSKDADLKAVHHLKTSFDDVSDYCNNFTDAIDEARRICRLRDVDPTFQDYVWKKRSDILTSWLKTRLTNAEQRFWITVFNCVIDVVTSQLTQQFAALNNIAAKFSVISQVS